jgi:transcriptional regulator with AAA-type ATPase domain
MITEYFNATKIPFLEEVTLDEVCDNRSLRKGIEKLNFFMETRCAALVYGRSGTGKQYF